MDTFFKNFTKLFTLSLSAVLSFNAMAQENISTWVEDDIHAIPQFTEFLKQRHKSESNFDIFDMDVAPVPNAQVGDLFYRSTNDRDFDGHKCEFLYESQNLPLAKGQSYKITESGMFTTQKAGKKQLYIQLNFSEQEKYLNGTRIEYRPKANGNTFSYTCFLTMEAVKMSGYNHFLHGLHGYLISPTLKAAAFASKYAGVGQGKIGIHE